MSKCEVCGANTEERFVSASSLGGFSFGACRRCARDRLEPLWALEFMIESTSTAYMDDPVYRQWLSMRANVLARRKEVESAEDSDTK